MSVFKKVINPLFSIGDPNESRKRPNQENQILILCPERPEDFEALETRIKSEKPEMVFFFLRTLDAEGKQKLEEPAIDFEEALKFESPQGKSEYTDYSCKLQNETIRFYFCIAGTESSRWKTLTEQYINETAKRIVDHAEREKPRCSPEARKYESRQHQGNQEENSSELKDKRTEANDNGQQEKSTFHPPQILIGEEILKHLEEKMKENFHNFENFEFVFLVPDRISLEDQTKERVKQDLRSFCKNGATNHDDIVIRINTTSVEMKNKWSNLMEKVKENPNTLFILIHDECHWAAGHGKRSATFMGFGKCDPTKCHEEQCDFQSCLKSECKSQDYHFRDLKLIPNLFTIMVSATPFNYLVIPNLKEHDIVDWKAVVKLNQKGTNNISKAYQGLTELRRQKKIKSYPTKPNTLRINGFSPELIGVLVEYASALSGSPCPNEDVSNFVRECIENKKLIVLRVSPSSNKLAMTTLAVNVLKMAAERGNIKNLNIFSDETPIKDLPKDAATIFIIVERARMGDTLPQNFLAFDLRPRYLKTVYDFTTIHQDIGRGFGYGERPTVLLSPEADKFLQDVWNDETDTISKDGFQKVVHRVLGQNMEKKENTEDNENSESQDEDEFEFGNDLNIIQSTFKPDENNPVFLCRLKHPQSFDHRLFLKAEPQIGKTGAILSFLFQLSQKVPYKPLASLGPIHFNDNSSASFSGENPIFFKEYTKTVYKTKTLSEIGNWIKTYEGNEKHQQYTKEILNRRKTRKEKEIPEPSQCAAKFLVEDLEDTEKSEITIADFGCADMAFAMHLDDELGKLDDDAETKKTTIKVEGFDFQVSKLLNLLFITLAEAK
jgi:hypothetical protein